MEKTNISGSSQPSCDKKYIFSHISLVSYKVRVIKLVVKAVVNQQHLAEKTRKRVSRLSKVFQHGFSAKSTTVGVSTRTHTHSRHTHLPTHSLTHPYIYTLSLVTRTPTN